MRTMTEAEYKQCLMHGTRAATAATIQADGRPYITPIWFVLDGDDAIFNTHETSLKAKALKRGSRFSLCVDGETPPFHYVTIEGTATLSEEPDERGRCATLIGGRCIGADHAEEYGKRNGVPGDYLVRVKTNKILARSGIAE